MSPLYTLPEIARLTGIPLSDLESYEREFADFLPEPQWSLAATAVANPHPERRAPACPAASGRHWSWRLREGLRRWSRRWTLALHALLSWPGWRALRRVLYRWRRGFEPA